MMKEYSVKITNLGELMRFESFVRKYNLHGEFRQRDFRVNIRSGFLIMLGLPFKNATVVLENCPSTVDVERQIAAF